MMTTLRKSGSEMWQDESLNDWPDGDYRVFVGDLGNEVNDEHLATAFRKYQSFHRAKVFYSIDLRWSDVRSLIRVEDMGLCLYWIHKTI